MIVGLPTILAVRRPGPEAFLVTVVNGLAEKIRAVLVRLIVAAAAIVPIDRSRVEVWIAIIIGVPVVLKINLLLTQARYILFLKTVLRHTFLLL